MAAHGEALAGDGLAVADALDQAVADYGVRVLACEGSECVGRAGLSRCVSGSTTPLAAHPHAAWAHAPTIVSVMVRDVVLVGLPGLVEGSAAAASAMFARDAFFLL